ncbi:hypothetical protein BQ8482_110564 [Mesorhizobium delmotii]|uniref:Uncharacterized protein n=1 Tax=Mesorhizobium delmotii TaxID=1631247 RepID=A0A2P9ABZ6_9HYPH|nr:hypothetical protein BQ8482_110564 [Mesorhizobium delmotii]
MNAIQALSQLSYGPTPAVYRRRCRRRDPARVETAPLVQRLLTPPSVNIKPSRAAFY